MVPSETWYSVVLNTYMKDASYKQIQVRTSDANHVHVYGKGKLKDITHKRLKLKVSRVNHTITHIVPTRFEALKIIMEFYHNDIRQSTFEISVAQDNIKKKLNELVKISQDLLLTERIEGLS